MAHQYGTITLLKQYLCLLFYISVSFLVVPLLWCITFPIRQISVYLLGRNETNGKILSHADGICDEDFVNWTPKTCIVTTVELDGDISVDQVRSIFKANVLDAKICENGYLWKRRYPELQQYYSSFMGFRFRKTDPNFDISHHIWEISFQPAGDDKKVVNKVNLSMLHEKLQNERFQGQKSPWELLVVRNVVLEDSIEIPRKTVLAFRMHHSMGDAKSILKLFVECFGQKPLKAAVAKDQSMSKFRKLVFYLAFPIYVLAVAGYILYHNFRSQLHPWKTPRKGDATGKVVVGFSEKIYLDDLKNISKRNDVTTSSTIICVIAGAIRRFDIHKKVSKTGIATAYTLPMANHPQTLSNHLYASIFTIPTDEESTTNRLRKSQQNFERMRRPELCICGNFLGYLVGTLPFSSRNPFRLNHHSAITITNIAGESEGFKIGGIPCSGFRMSVGVMPGQNGLMFCIFSYKDGLRIALSGSESVIGKHEVDSLVKEIGNEVQALKQI